jgi:hypothetical protein
VNVSILLSTYWEEGIVFSADRNATIVYQSGAQDVEVDVATKVFAWPRRKALVGVIGLGQLAGLHTDEWMRQFVAKTRDFDDIDELAQDLLGMLQSDFQFDYASAEDVSRKGMIVHLGGFADREGVPVPVMYLITNIPRMLTAFKPYPYPDAEREFVCSDLMNEYMSEWGADYPQGVRSKIGQIVSRGDFLWFNNGLEYPTFNQFKSALWQVLSALRESRVLPTTPSLRDRASFSVMAVRTFGLFYEHHFPLHQRGVGVGADTVSMPWPV